MSADERDVIRLDPESSPRLRPDVELAELDGEAVIFDPASHRVHRLNHSATEIVIRLSSGLTPEEITAELSGAYGADPQEIRAVVGEVIDALSAEGILIWL